MSNMPTVFWWYGALGVGVMILVAAFLIIATGKELRADRRRKVDLATVAARINADYLPDDPSVLQWFTGTPFHPYSRRAAASGVMRGQVWEAHAIFFDLDVETALDAETSVHYKQTVAMFHVGEGGMPAFSLERRGDDALADDFTGPGATPLVELPGNPAFSSKFRLIVLWGKLPGPAPARRRLRRQDSARDEAGGHSGRAADQIRSDHQSEDRQGPRAHDPAFAAAAGGSGDRVTPLDRRPIGGPLFAEGGGRLRLIATLHDPAVIRTILTHLGLAPSGPRPAPAPPRPAPPRPDRFGVRRPPRGAISADLPGPPAA